MENLNDGNHALVGFSFRYRCRKERDRLTGPSTLNFSCFRRPYTEVGRNHYCTLSNLTCQPPKMLFSKGGPLKGR